MRMALDPVLSKYFPRDFHNIPFGTKYGESSERQLNQNIEERRILFFEEELKCVLAQAVATKNQPMFTTALIAGDAVILDALARAELLDKVSVVFVDTFTLFPESLQHLKEVENYYGFKSLVYHARGCTDQDDYFRQYGRDFWMKDIDKYDMLCKVQ